MEQYIVMLEPWYKAIAIFLGFTVFRYVYKIFILRLIRAVTGKLNLKLAEDILQGFEHPINVMLWIWNFSLALDASPLDTTSMGNFLNHLMRSSLIFSFFWGVYNITNTTHGVMLNLLERMGIKKEPTVANLFSAILHILVVLIGFAAIAKEWNYDISAFLASLSIGSVAVAFAAKDALANVFGSLVIILDKPFKVGDWISVNGTEGIVENISFRSTCIRTFPNELVYIPNNLLSNVHITNFSKRERSRIDFTLGFTYDTSREKMEEAIAHIRAFLDSRAYLIKDTIEVGFASYGDSSLNVRVICYTPIPVGPQYRACLTDMNLGLLDVIEDVGVSCAFPSTSIYFENELKMQDNEEK